MNTVDTTFSTEIKSLMSEIEEKVVLNYSLADAIREGSTVTSQAHGWGEEGAACALTAAALAARARGFLGDK